MHNRRIGGGGFGSGIDNKSVSDHSFVFVTVGGVFGARVGRGRGRRGTVYARHDWKISRPYGIKGKKGRARLLAPLETSARNRERGLRHMFVPPLSAGQ